MTLKKQATLAITILWAIFLIAMANTVEAETIEFSTQTGYHFAGMNSSDTFYGSGTDDTDFSGWCNLIEATYWIDSVGLYAFYGKDRTITEDIWVDSKYKAKTYYLGIGIKYQWEISKNWWWYAGGGITEATLKHSYDTYAERLSAYGPEGIVGLKWAVGNGYGVLLNGRYSSYKMGSMVWHGDYFKPGGLRTFVGVYWEY